MFRQLLVGALLLVAPENAIAGGKPGRHAGRILSLTPHDGILTVEESGAGGTFRVLQVDVRHAQVVNVSRDPSRPWEWRERSAEIFRFPVGTFIVVIGVDQASGVVRAYRLEVPK